MTERVLISLSARQREVLTLLQANRGCIFYARAIGTLQPSAALYVAGEIVPRGAVTVEALERKGLVKVDRRDFTAPTWLVHVTVRGREALR